MMHKRCQRKTGLALSKVPRVPHSLSHPTNIHFLQLFISLPKEALHQQEIVLKQYLLFRLEVMLKGVSSFLPTHIFTHA